MNCSNAGFCKYFINHVYLLYFVAVDPWERNNVLWSDSLCHGHTHETWMGILYTCRNLMSQRLTGQTVVISLTNYHNIMWDRIKGQLWFPSCSSSHFFMIINSNSTELTPSSNLRLLEVRVIDMCEECFNWWLVGWEQDWAVGWAMDRTTTMFNLFWFDVAWFHFFQEEIPTSSQYVQTHLGRLWNEIYFHASIICASSWLETRNSLYPTNVTLLL